ncbi:MAG: hypothetical protein D6680_04975 [Cyanobacteria bacterium J007]|jgi:hypothetical protein|nr:MAG: hypothetical protein D6680_04975 [Cyanobacteria bacterium J007]
MDGIPASVTLAEKRIGSADPDLCAKIHTAVQIFSSSHSLPPSRSPQAYFFTVEPRSALQFWIEKVQFFWGVLFVAIASVSIEVFRTSWVALVQVFRFEESQFSTQQISNLTSYSIGA